MEHNLRSAREETDGPVRRYDYDDGSVIVADVGPADGHAEVVDGTVVVVTDGGHREFEAPAGAARAVMNNGVVTIETEDPA
ncbi:hypothetical protein BRC88_12130 [Halobacteriales archaeon QS_4_69_225]|nr:MAG: hypothetical protein BRC88_12130 [Halobacteriales archaeon QS_4_69_225]